MRHSGGQPDGDHGQRQLTEKGKSTWLGEILDNLTQRTRTGLFQGLSGRSSYSADRPLGISIREVGLGSERSHGRCQSLPLPFRPFTIFKEGCSMGASGWDYVTPYDGDVEAALEALQARVFQEEYGDGSQYRSLEDLYEDEEFMGTEGTHTILDIDQVVAMDDPPMRSRAADYGTLRPLALSRVVHHFGTDRPTVEQYKKLVAAAKEAASHEEHERSLLGECQMRWTGYYVVLCSDDTPTHLGIFGFSGD
ncbi:hypothetical protein [Streptomyces sp. NPDC000229]|uniref:hypothetical protein n=1 Tax=Streptomyces sp. NPDC000229 TaxID=3154247 RepID=UPI003325FF0F